MLLPFPFCRNREKKKKFEKSQPWVVLCYIQVFKLKLKYINEIGCWSKEMPLEGCVKPRPSRCPVNQVSIEPFPAQKRLQPNSGRRGKAWSLRATVWFPSLTLSSESRQSSLRLRISLFSVRRFTGHFPSKASTWASTEFLSNSNCKEMTRGAVTSMPSATNLAIRMGTYQRKLLLD